MAQSKAPNSVAVSAGRRFSGPERIDSVPMSHVVPDQVLMLFQRTARQVFQMLADEWLSFRHVTIPL
jgi:hypothetical protein